MNALAAERSTSNPALAVARFAALLTWTAACYPTFLLRAAVTKRHFRHRVCARWTHRWLKGCAALMGIRVEVSGMEPPTPVLLTPNHTGYIDVVAVGAAVSCFFLGRADVAHWPGIGLLFRSTQHIGIDRRDKLSLGGVVRHVAQRLEEGGSVCVFLEGGTTDGSAMKPFRASLAQAAVDAQVYTVPVGIRWHIHQPDASVAADVAYWRGDHSFLPHLWHLLGLRGLHAELAFGEPIAPADHTRKSLSAAAQNAVAGLRQAL